MTLISLKEHETFPPKKNLNTKDPRIQQLEEISFQDNDIALQEELQKKNILTISSDPFNKRLRFSTQSHIGVAQFSNFTIAITPKFSTIERLVELIDYTYDLDLEIFPESETQFEGEKNILTEIIISTFVRKCQILMRQGLYKSYNLKEDNVKFLRGKLLVTQQILNQAKTKLQFACEYDELEYNNLENQIVLFCLEQSYHLTINEKRKNDIRRLVQNFANLVNHKNISLDDFKKLNYNQMNHHYRKTHELCKLIVNNTQITNFYDQKMRFVNSFFVNMNDVFETFVFKLFYEFYFFPVKEQQSSVSWITERERQSINIITDILIFEKDRKTVRTIIDTKYKEELTDGDRYQLSHYAHDYEKSEVYAILPKFDGAVADSFRGAKQDIQIKIRYIEIDKILDWIYSKENHSKEIREYIEKLVPLESDQR